MGDNDAGIQGFKCSWVWELEHLREFAGSRENKLRRFRRLRT